MLLCTVVVVESAEVRVEEAAEVAAPVEATVAATDEETTEETAPTWEQVSSQEV